MTRVRRVAVSSSLAGEFPSDYAVAFELSGTRHRRDAQSWARAIWQYAPAPLPVVLYAGWRAFLGLRLAARDDPRTVLGWAVTDTAPGTVSLDAAGRFLAARNIVSVHADGLTWTTLVHFTDRRGRWLWRAAVPMHLLLVPFTVRRAAR